MVGFFFNERTFRRRFWPPRQRLKINEYETATTKIASKNAEIRWGADGMFRVRKEADSRVKTATSTTTSRSRMSENAVKR